MTLREHFLGKKTHRCNSTGNDHEIDLLQKFSFAIPFREDPYCNPRNIIRGCQPKIIP